MDTNRGYEQMSFLIMRKETNCKKALFAVHINILLIMLMLVVLLAFFGHASIKM